MLLGMMEGGVESSSNVEIDSIHLMRVRDRKTRLAQFLSLSKITSPYFANSLFRFEIGGSPRKSCAEPMNKGVHEETTAREGFSRSMTLISPTFGLARSSALTCALLVSTSMIEVGNMECLGSRQGYSTEGCGNGDKYHNEE